jgi:hypothetical protein
MPLHDVLCHLGQESFDRLKVHPTGHASQIHQSPCDGTPGATRQETSPQGRVERTETRVQHEVR